jgi:hypothetical protein
MDTGSDQASSSTKGRYLSETFPSSQSRLMRSWRPLASSWSVCEKSMPPASVPRTELWPVTVPMTQASYLSFFHLE